MAMSFDYAHPCPRCGSAWKVRMQPLVVGGGYDDDHYWVPAGSGGCSNPRCSISPREVSAYREMRRRRGWDPSLSEAG